MTTIDGFGKICGADYLLGVHSKIRKMQSSHRKIEGFPEGLRRVLVCLLLLMMSAIASRAADSDEQKQRLYLFFQGREIYQNNCLPCHGSSGKGDGDWAADWTKNRPRNFRSGVFKFRSTPMGFLPTDEDLKRTILGGISGTAMPTFKGHLRDEDLEAVISYIKSFSREWKKDEKKTEAHKLPNRPDWMKSLERSKPHIESGKSVFNAHCVVCHGTTGKGDGPGSVALKDVWGFEIKPADLAGSHYKSGDRPEDLYRTIALGLDGTPMVGFLGTLKAEQIWDVVAYLNSLKAEKKK